MNEQLKVLKDERDSSALSRYAKQAHAGMWRLSPAGDPETPAEAGVAEVNETKHCTDSGREGAGKKTVLVFLDDQLRRWNILSIL